MDLPSTLGEFRVLAMLGAGGSGVVYDAMWGARRVALKVLLPELVASERDRAKFLAEAARLQTVAHPSVVKVLAAGALPDGRPYLAMERLEGESLASMLSRGPLARPLALALFEELAGAVTALHAQNLIHRDLKPENVYIVEGRHAVLLDFGIAREADAPRSTTTRAGNVRGTPAYMAPERFYGQPACVATDVYELAVTLYAMLAGRLPWTDLADPEARLTPRPLTSVPRELDVEVRGALSTRAERRPESAAAFAERVRAAASTGAPPADAATGTLRASPPRTSPLALAIVVIGAAAAAVALVWLLRARVATVDAPSDAAPDAGPIDRVEMASALDRVPADAQLVITATVGEHAKNARYAHLVGLVAKKLDMRGRIAPSACLDQLAPRAEWVVYAVPSLIARRRATVIARGAWTRAEVERCVKDVPLAWLDERTVYLNFRDEDTPTLLAARGGATRKLRSQLASIREPHTLAIAIDGADGLVWFEPVPDGSDAVMWMRFTGDDGVYEIAVDPHDGEAADDLARRLRDSAMLSGVFGPSMIEVAREGTGFRVRGRW